MSNQSIPLEVIYNRLEETPVQSFYSQSTAIALDEESLSSIPTKKKTKKTGCCAKFVLCCWCMFLLTIFGLTIGSMFMGYAQLKGCFHSKNYELTELITASEFVNEINFDVVTGGVLFTTHSESEIIVKFYRSARDADTIDGIIPTLELNEGVLTIASVSPAFDFNSCQFSYIEILFPIDYANNQVDPISITGSVKAGFVEMGELSNLGNVAITVDVGSIEMELINANSIEVQGGLAYVDVNAAYATEHAKFAVETGSVRTQDVMSPEFEAIAGYGTSWNTDLQTDKAVVHTKYGYATVLRPSHFTENTDQTVDVHSYYGKALATYDLAYNVDFTVTGEYGDIAVMFEDDCALEDEASTEDLLVGSCSSSTEELQSTLPKTTISVSVNYGNSIFFQQEAESDISYPEELDQEEYQE